MDPSVPARAFEGARPIFHQGASQFFIADIIFATVALVLCVLIYFKTKEVFDLTKHKGIEYFRDAFLLFGLAYLMKFLFGVFAAAEPILDLDLPRRFMFHLFMFPMGIFSTSAILFLIGSVSWGKFTFKHQKAVIIGSSIILAFISFWFRSHFFLLAFQILLLIVGIVFVAFFQNAKKAFSKQKLLYYSVSVLWLLNLLALAKPGFGKGPISWIVSVASIAAFAFVYYKVTKWLR